MPTAHATLGPSSATRWLNCTASVGLIEEVFPDGADSGGIYAQEGTWAHTAAELKAAEALGTNTNKRAHNTQWRKWRNEVPREFHDEMLGHAERYADTLAEIRDSMAGDPLVLLEQKVDTGVPGVWGTADATLASEQELVVCDFKYGRGVQVTPDSNPQLMLYGLGAINEIGGLLVEFSPGTPVTLVVVQPRAGGTSTWATTVGELEQFRDDVVLPAAQAIDSGNTEFAPSEDACRWCPVAGRCAAQTAWATRRDFAPSGQMDPADIAEALADLPGIEAWCKAVRDKALQMAYDEAQEIPGWKAVQASGKRSIKDHQGAIDVLAEAGQPPEKTSRANTQTITTLQKLVGGADELEDILGDLLTRSPGKQTLVEDTDPRPAITAESVAQSDFAEPLED